MEEQDRSQWDQQLIQRAQEYLNQSAQGTVISPFHLEAGIAYHHCTARSYARNRLARDSAPLRMPCSRFIIPPSTFFNRAIVVAQIDGPQAGIRALDEAGQDATMRRYHLFDATLGEFYRRAGDCARARQHFEMARQKTTSPFDHQLIDRRLSQCLGISGS